MMHNAEGSALCQRARCANNIASFRKPTKPIFRTTILVTVLLATHCEARDGDSLLDRKMAQKPLACAIRMWLQWAR